jgi:hypothetical protein
MKVSESFALMFFHAAAVAVCFSVPDTTGCHLSGSRSTIVKRRPAPESLAVWFTIIPAGRTSLLPEWRNRSLKCCKVLIEVVKGEG